MAMFLQIAFYAALVGLLAILALGLVNITRNDDGQASRSNKLMRMRVLVQAILVGILIAMGIVFGSIKLF